MRVVTQSKVPAGSGLGGSSALAVAVAAAVARATGRDVAPKGSWPVVRDAEARCLGVPAGVQDHHAALHGGVLALHLEAGRGARGAPADRPRARRGVPSARGRGGHALLGDQQLGRVQGTDRRGQPREGVPLRDRRPRRPGPAKRSWSRATATSPGSSREEWEARKRLAPGVTTPEIDRIAEVVAQSGGAAKVCGAGGGGVVAVWSTPGERGPGGRETVLQALKDAGFRSLPGPGRPARPRSRGDPNIMMSSTRTRE